MSGAATEVRRPELEWLAEVLWGPNSGVELVVGGRVPAGVPASQRWGVLPDLRRPRVLVPLTLGAGRRRGGPPVQRRHDPAGPAGQGGGRSRPGQRRPPLVAGPPRPDRGRRRAGHRDPARRPRPGGPRPVRPGGRDRPRPGPTQPQAGGAAHRPRRPAGRLHEGRLERPHPAPGPGRGRHAPAPRPVPTRAASPPPTCSTRASGRAWTSPISSALPHRLWRRGRRYALPPVAVSREIAALGGVEETTLGESGWWSRLRSRLAPIRQALPDEPADPPQGTAGVAGARGRRPRSTAPWNGWRGWPGPGWSSAPGTATGGRGTCAPPPGGCSSGTGSAAPTASPSASTCSTSATRRPSRAWASRRPRPPPPAATGPPRTWPSWASGRGSRSCCATCTCWSGSAGPPRPRCRR